MTERQLRLLPFKCISHLSLAEEHAMVYSNDTYDIHFCRHVPTEKYSYDEVTGKKIRPYCHWMIKGKVYDTKKEMLKAIKNIPFFTIIKTNNKE